MGEFYDQEVQVAAQCKSLDPQGLRTVRTRVDLTQVPSSNATKKLPLDREMGNAGEMGRDDESPRRGLTNCGS